MDFRGCRCGPGRVEAGPRAIEPALAGLGQPLAAPPQCERLLERGATGLQPLHDLRQFGAGLLVAEVLARVALLLRSTAHKLRLASTLAPLLGPGGPAMLTRCRLGKT